MYESKTAAQIYALALGLLLLAAAIVGFVLHPLGLAEDSFDYWHEGSYLLLSMLSFATWRRADSARIFAVASGLIFLALGAWGVAASIAGVKDVGFMLVEPHAVRDALLAALGVTGVAISFFSPRHGDYPMPEGAASAA